MASLRQPCNSLAGLARRAASSLESRLTSSWLASTSGSGTSGSGGLAAASSLQQRRGLVEVDVKNNSVDRALKDLNRKLNDDGIIKTWQRQEFHIKGTEQRKMAAAETEKRARKRRFAAQISWIMRRKAKGF